MHSANSTPPLSGFAMASLPSSSVLSTFVCHNPQCMSRCKSFENERGYTMHFRKSPACFDFVRQETMQVIPNCKCMQVPKKHQYWDVKWSTTTKQMSCLQHIVVYWMIKGIQRVNTTVIMIILILRMMTTSKPTIMYSMTQLMIPRHVSFWHIPFFPSDQKWTIALLKFIGWHECSGLCLYCCIKMGSRCR